jgi:hypothetical protein
MPALRDPTFRLEVAVSEQFVAGLVIGTLIGVIVGIVSAVMLFLLVAIITEPELPRDHRRR